MNMSFDGMSTKTLAWFDPVNTSSREKYLSFLACEGGIEKIIVAKRVSMGN